MRAIKTILVLLLVVTTILFVGTRISERFSDRNDGPVISCAQEILDVSVTDDQEKLLSGVTARDSQDGDLTKDILIAGVSKLIAENTAKVTYLVFDSDNNMGSCTRMVRYTDYQQPVFSVGEPLVFASVNGIQLADRVTATDVIDGDISGSVRASALQATDMADVYSVTFQVTNSMGDTARVNLPVILRGNNTNQPEVTLNQQLIYLKKGSGFDPRIYVASVKSPLGDASTRDVQIENPVDTQQAGTYWVVYSYASGNSVGTAILTVVVE